MDATLTEPEHDLVFVTAEANRGWILDGICRDMGPYLAGDIVYHYGLDRLPSSSAYFFSHYSLYTEALRERLLPPKAKTLVFYTHPSGGERPRRRLIADLSKCTKVLSMSSMHGEQLVSLGLPRDRVMTVLGAGDPTIFTPHERGGGAVGLVSAYYARKSPEKMIDLIRTMPETPFVLVGRGWRESPVADRLSALPNLDVVEPAYADYPAHYARMDVFVSLSALEGGPIPLIEAMLSNVVPVSTRTGFAPDVVQHGMNGFLCEVNAPTEKVVSLIHQAFELPGDIRSTVEHLDWRRYAQCVSSALSG